MRDLLALMYTKGNGSATNAKSLILIPHKGSSNLYRAAFAYETEQFRRVQTCVF